MMQNLNISGALDSEQGISNTGDEYPTQETEFLDYFQRVGFNAGAWPDIKEL